MNSVDRLEEAHKQVGIALQDDSFELSEIRRCQLEDVHGILQQFVDANRRDADAIVNDGDDSAPSYDVDDIKVDVIDGELVAYVDGRGGDR